MKDTDVLSPAAFGGYVRLLFKLHAASPRGEVHFTLPQLCRVFAAATMEETQDILSEITDPAHNICEYSKKGDKHYFINRRMKKEALKSEVRSAAGKLGAAKTNAKNRQYKKAAEKLAAAEGEQYIKTEDTTKHQHNYNNNSNNSDTGDNWLEEDTENGTFCADMETILPSASLEAIERNQFAYTKSKNTDYIRSQWKTFLSERLADPPERRRQYKQLSDLTSYFTNWMRNKFPPNASDKNDRKTNSKNAGAWQLLESLREDIEPASG